MEWDTLAAWVVQNRLHSNNNMWMIQVGVGRWLAGYQSTSGSVCAAFMFPWLSTRRPAKCVWCCQEGRLPGDVPLFRFAHQRAHLLHVSCFCVPLFCTADTSAVQPVQGAGHHREL